MHVMAKQNKIHVDKCWQVKGDNWRKDTIGKTEYTDQFLKEVYSLMAMIW